MLMEKISGKPLDWNAAPLDAQEKILSQLADVYLELEKHPLDLTGSLIPAEAGIQVGAFSQLQLFPSPEDPLGPFPSAATAYESMFQRQLDLLASRQFTSLSVDHYLAFR